MTAAVSPDAMHRSSVPDATPVEAAPYRPPGHIENGVLVGHDGMLFLAGGAHRVLDLATGALPLDTRSFEASRINHLSRTSIAARRGFAFLHIITPDKQSFLPTLWPIADKPLIRSGERLIAHLGADATAIDYPLDLLTAVGSAAASRVDTHYSDRGTILIAARAAALLTGEADDIKDRLLADLTGTVTHTGDLGSKLTPTESATEAVYGAPLPGQLLSNQLQGINNGIIDIWLNPAARDARRLALIGDSFGRHIAKFLQFWFREILFLRSQFFHHELTDYFQPHLVITQNVERYIANMVPDSLRKHALLLPMLRGQAYTPSQEFVETLATLLSVGRPEYARFVRARFGTEPDV